MKHYCGNEWLIRINIKTSNDTMALIIIKIATPSKLPFSASSFAFGGTGTKYFHVPYTYTLDADIRTLFQLNPVRGNEKL